ncbi:unnamed protein product [Linum trigynum]|uniref:Lysosomal Pro-X carboxypeptidase n=1 Tax=Linum trigynum TaxID=586398 RepID=A0AAV2DJP3_9ROSI
MKSTGAATTLLLMTPRRPPGFFLFFLLLVLSATSPLVSAARSRSIPRLGVTAPREVLGITHNKNVNVDAAVAETTPHSPIGLQTYYYNQTLDHFSFTPGSYATFPQRYVINFDHWRGGGSGAPIFAELGAEASLGNDVGAVGFLPENAPKFGALQVYIEHRFYGNSVPFGSQEEALKNATVRGYFNSEQALADYAEVLLHVKKSLKAENSPIIVFGGSYGGMLATWFRLKYPHIALGALASSAPILYFDDITPSNGYYSVITKDFKETSETCYHTIKESWAVIDRLAAHNEGLAILSKKFRSCKKLSVEGVEALKSQLDSIYCVAAQYNRAPPSFGLQKICDAIDHNKPTSGGNSTTHLLDRIFAGIAAYSGIDTGCYNYTGDDGSFSAETLSGWDWQTCSELVMPIGVTGVNDTMFPKEPFDMKEFAEDCKSKYGVLPRPHWITSYYGGHDIKEVLKRFGSNIIFSNGLVDPYSSAGVLEDISESLVALKTEKGSHCMDIVRWREDDPEWLVEMRLKEIEIISGWIMQYYQDLIQATS